MHMKWLAHMTREQVVKPELAGIADNVPSHHSFEIEAHMEARLTCESAASLGTADLGSSHRCNSRVLARKPADDEGGWSTGPVQLNLRLGRADATMPLAKLEMEREFSDRWRGFRYSDTKTRLSGTEGTGCCCSWKMNPTIRCARKMFRKKHWQGTFAAAAGSAIYHLTIAGAGLRDGCTTICQQDLGWKPEKSTGAPAFRYCVEMAVNDRCGLLRGTVIQGRFNER